MVDDDMEISSEHGHNAGEEEIDIDIDLTAGQVDEDYVLEDAQSNNDFGDGFQPQPSPAMQDDLMVDEEDNASYAMEDDTLQEHDNQSMDHEVVPMSFSDADPTNANLNTNGLADATRIDQDNAQEAEIMWDNAEETAQNADIAAEVSEETTLLSQSFDNAGEKVSDETEAEIQENTASLQQDNYVGDSDGNSPQKKSPEEQHSRHQSPTSDPVREVSGSPVNPDLKAGTAVDDYHVHNDTTSRENADDLDHSDPEYVNLSSLMTRIVVVYQSREYSLFSTSDEDDPDNFFLTDVSFAAKPINELLAAMQEVINEEIPDDEWLCMTVDELGLEFDQTSTESHQITLQQVLNLRDQLLYNDGAESPQPLYILLNSIVNFGARYLTLTSGAANGKGLSELMTWDSRSESHGETGDFEDSNVNDEQYLENSQSHEKVAEEPEITDGSNETTAAETSASQPNDGSNLDFGHAEKSPSDGEHGASPNRIEPSDDKHPNVVYVSAISLSTNQDEEEGDLIDYEDEEFGENETSANKVPTAATNGKSTQDGTFAHFISYCSESEPCYKPGTCFCSTCDAKRLEHFANIDEELRRRSLSRSAEDSSLVDESILQLSRANNRQGNEDDAIQPGKDIDNDEENNDYETGQGNSGHEHTSADDDGATDHFDDQYANEDEDPAIPSAFEEEEEAQARNVDDNSRHEIDLVARPTVLGSDTGDDNGDGYEGSEDEPPEFGENELGFGDNNLESGEHEVDDQRLPDFHQGSTSTDDYSHITDEGNKTDAATNIVKESNSAASSLGFADAADSESATIASANTLEAEADEINYEDEIDDKTLEVAVTANGTATVLSSKQEDGERVLDQEPRDEIDYEDDVEDDVIVVQPAPTPKKELPAHNGGSAKRPRADADLEDATGVRGKEAKRVRS